MKKEIKFEAILAAADVGAGPKLHLCWHDFVLLGCDFASGSWSVTYAQGENTFTTKVKRTQTVTTRKINNGAFNWPWTKTPHTSFPATPLDRLRLLSMGMCNSLLNHEEAGRRLSYLTDSGQVLVVGKIMDALLSEVLMPAYLHSTGATADWAAPELPGEGS